MAGVLWTMLTCMIVGALAHAQHRGGFSGDGELQLKIAISGPSPAEAAGRAEQQGKDWSIVAGIVTLGITFYLGAILER